MAGALLRRWVLCLQLRPGRPEAGALCWQCCPYGRGGLQGRVAGGGLARSVDCCKGHY